MIDGMGHDWRIWIAGNESLGTNVYKCGNCQMYKDIFYTFSQDELVTSPWLAVRFYKIIKTYSSTIQIFLDNGYGVVPPYTCNEFKFNNLLS